MPPNPYRRQPNINDMMYPKGSKQPRQVWAAVMNVYKAPPSTTPTTPTPTPSITASPTVTPTPTVTIGLTPTATETQTPTPTNTPTNTATQTGTPSVTSSPTSTPTQTQSGTPQVTSSPTNTPTQTQTGTPSVTSTPTSTPTQTQTGTLAVTSTPTPSPTPTAFTGYGYNLVTTPYNPPSSGNTIFTNFSVTGATSGITNPNTFDVNGVYWSIIDRTGTDTTSYFSGITGTSFQVSFYQNGQTAIYSGLTDTIQYDDQPSLTDSFFYSPNQRPGQLTLVQSASTNFSTSLPVYINWIGNILPTPSPTPTNTNTPTNTQTPSVTPTNTGTPVTPTPTNTNSPTPTNTLTPTRTPTPTPTRPPVDADATTYMNAVVANGGTLDSTLSAATQNLFYNLKQANIYNKMYAFYPILGGVAGSHKLNAKNPVDTNAAYRISFSGSVSHSASGMTGNGTTGWGDTKFNVGIGSPISVQSNFSFGVYINATGTTQGIIMGADATQNVYYLQLQSSTNRFYYGVRIYTITAPFVTLTGNTGFYAVSKTGTTTNIYHQNGVSITGATSEEVNFNNERMAIMAKKNAGSETAGNFSNDRVAFAYMSSGLTITELTSLNNIVQTFQTSCGRNV